MKFFCKELLLFAILLTCKALGKYIAFEDKEFYKLRTW